MELNGCQTSGATLPRHDVNEPQESLPCCFAPFKFSYKPKWCKKVKELYTRARIFRKLKALGVRIIPPRQLRERTEASYLGHGSFGKIVIGQLHGEKVAIKTHFAQEGTSRTALLKSCLNEVKMMNGHSHSNVISCKGVCLARNSLHIVMEYCPGDSLNILLRSDRYQKKSWTFKVNLALGIARGMLFLHSQEPPIVHCDLKSPNIVLKADHTPVIADFGLASLLRAKTIEDQNATWLAPEVACRGEEATTKSDVYSFGIIMWEILTGEIPWDGAHSWAIKNALRNKQRPQVSRETMESCKNCKGADDYIALMENCWHEDPEMRPNFEYVMNQLESVLSMSMDVANLTSGKYVPMED